MTWGEELASRSQEFEAESLPRGQALDPEDSTLLGVGIAAPEENAQGEGGGLVEGSATRGKTAWRRRLSPRHRRAVRSFFRRE